MVSTRPPTSKSSSPFSNPLVTVPNAPITIGIIVTCIFHSSFNSLATSRYLSLFSYSFSFIVVSWDIKVDYFASSLFLLITIKSGLLAGIRWSVCMLKSLLLLLLVVVVVVFTPLEFFTSALVDGLSLKFEWQHVSSIPRTLLSILADLTNAVVWIVFLFRSPPVLWWLH